jgi:hypothetical protein
MKLPLCKDCKSYRLTHTTEYLNPPHGAFKASVHSCANVPDLVSGLVRSDRCMTARSEKSPCGPEGRLFEAVE